MRLYHTTGPKAGYPCETGDELTSFRGESAEYLESYEPRREGSTGRVAVIMHNYRHEYYPGVFNLVWKG